MNKGRKEERKEEKKERQGEREEGRKVGREGKEGNASLSLPHPSLQ